MSREFSANVKFSVNYNIKPLLNARREVINSKLYLFFFPLSVHLTICRTVAKNLSGYLTYILYTYINSSVR